MAPQTLVLWWLGLAAGMVLVLVLGTAHVPLLLLLVHLVLLQQQLLV